MAKDLPMIRGLFKPSTLKKTKEKFTLSVAQMEVIEASLSHLYEDNERLEIISSKYAESLIEPIGEITETTTVLTGETDEIIEFPLFGEIIELSTGVSIEQEYFYGLRDHVEEKDKRNFLKNVFNMSTFPLIDKRIFLTTNQFNSLKNYFGYE